MKIWKKKTPRPHLRHRKRANFANPIDKGTCHSDRLGYPSAIQTCREIEMNHCVIPLTKDKRCLPVQHAVTVPSLSFGRFLDSPDILDSLDIFGQFRYINSRMRL